MSDYDEDYDEGYDDEGYDYDDDNESDEDYEGYESDEDNGNNGNDEFKGEHDNVSYSDMQNISSSCSADPVISSVCGEMIKIYDEKEASVSEIKLVLLVLPLLEIVIAVFSMDISPLNVSISKP